MITPLPPSKLSTSSGRGACQANGPSLPGPRPLIQAAIGHLPAHILGNGRGIGILFHVCGIRLFCRPAIPVRPVRSRSVLAQVVVHQEKEGGYSVATVSVVVHGSRPASHRRRG